MPLFILGILAGTIAYPASFIYDLTKKGITHVLKNAFWIISWTILAPTLLLVINRFFPYKERTYFLDDNQLVISKGKKKKQYSWDEFEYFYPYSGRYKTKSYEGLAQWSPYNIGEGQREKLFKTEKEVIGEIFYLKKKPKNLLSKLYRSFTIIYSEPNNNKEVLRFLSRHLERRDMKSTSDLGLVFYEFK